MKRINDMQKNTYEFLTQNLGISETVLNEINKAEEEIKGVFESLDDIMVFNQYKILRVFQENRVSDSHFSWNTGYGYNDAGRETLEKVYAGIFKTNFMGNRKICVSFSRTTLI